MNTITGAVVETETTGTTYYGNPIVNALIRDTVTRVTTWYRVSHNSGISYAIDNPEFKERAHTFDLTAAGRIKSYKRGPLTIGDVWPVTLNA